MNLCWHFLVLSFVFFKKIWILLFNFFHVNLKSGFCKALIISPRAKSRKHASFFVKNNNWIKVEVFQCLMCSPIIFQSFFQFLQMAMKLRVVGGGDTKIKKSQVCQLISQNSQVQSQVLEGVSSPRRNFSQVFPLFNSEKPFLPRMLLGQHFKFGHYPD